jgi:hypothetical protein
MQIKRVPIFGGVKLEWRYGVFIWFEWDGITIQNDKYYFHILKGCGMRLCRVPTSTKG